MLAVNALSNSHLVQPGMVLRIPARKPDSTPLAAPKGAKYYTVRNSDFDWSLARRHGLSLSQLKAMNPGVNFDNLLVGTRSALPKSGTTTTVVASAKPSGKDVRPAAKVAVRAHKVTEGEFDWVIAKHAGVTLSALRSANPGVDLNKLRIGQLLRLPVGSVPAAKAYSFRVASLHAKRSIGIGGHISREDADGDDLYRSGMMRELTEETVIEADYSEELVGFIYDDTSPVGRVHLGVVHLLTLTSPHAHARETELVDSGFESLASIKSKSAVFETWSQLCIEHLFR